MSLSDPDRELITETLGREPTPTERALFENLWSEHCAYRSSRPLLGAFESDGPQVVIGPGDDAAVLAVPKPAAANTPPGQRTEDDYTDTYLTFGIESHNHPSYVDPFDGAATGVGGIVRDTMSMGAYPIALADSLYFGPFENEHSRYLFEGVVEGISHYGNCIGVPTVAGSVDFHDGYVGNPLVNVACVGLTDADRVVTAEAQEPGNKLVLVGNATGRDGLGGASFASEDLGVDAETEDRPAVQVGDPYAEKRLIECNETLLDEGLVVSARDLGAAGLGGASAEMVAKGNLGAHIRLDRVHQREPNMRPLEILLAESQERMCYEIRPADVDRVLDLAERFDLGASVIGDVTEGNYVCTFEESGTDEKQEQSTRATDVTDAAAGQTTVVDAPAEFIADGAPMNDLPMDEPVSPSRALPDVSLETAVEAVISSPSTASKRWVYRQYDHEVGLRTAIRPGHDAAVLSLRETETGTETDTGTERGKEVGTVDGTNFETDTGSEFGPEDGTEFETESKTDSDLTGAIEDGQNSGMGLAISAGGNPQWTGVAPRQGARAIAIENATNLATVGARPLAAVDCLNGGNPEKPDVYGAFAAAVDGLASGCADLNIPVVGGNVSLYNDSETGPVPPTPTLAVIGTKRGYDAPGRQLSGRTDTELLLIGGTPDRLGGSEYVAQFGGRDQFPALPAEPADVIDKLARVGNQASTVAAHDVSHGGLVVTLAEMVTTNAGVTVNFRNWAAAFGETPGRMVVETTDPAAVEDALDGTVPSTSIGSVTKTGDLSVRLKSENVVLSAGEIHDRRAVIQRELR